MNKGLLTLAGFIFLSVLPAFAQQKTIKVSGTVVDNDNISLTGVVVAIKESALAVITDNDGHFYLEAPGKESILVISYIGYKTQEITVGNQINFDIVLQENVETLNEVVVTAYGTQKRMSVVGSISTVEPQKLRVGTTKSLSNNLAGQLAGVIAVRPSGEPGYDNSNFWIRGISSFAGNTAPLVLVDGIERNLNDLDPAEIESFSVLKDASASAMYGVRGANGVIIINTKRGAVGKPSVDFRIEHSIQTPTKLPEFIGAAEYMTLLNRIAGSDIYSADRISKTASRYDPDLYPDVNWLDAISKDYAYNTRANLTVSGGTPILRYALVASYFSEDGIMAVDKKLPYDTGTNLDRYNLRANVDLDVTPTTILRFNVGGYLQDLHKQNYSTENVFNQAFEFPPFLFPTIYSDGYIPKSALGTNPWAEVTQMGYLVNSSSKIESLFSVEQSLKMVLPGLKAKVLFSFDAYNSGEVIRAAMPTYYLPSTERDLNGNLKHPAQSLNTDGTEFLGHATRSEYGNNSTYFESTLIYNQVFANKHSIDALFLYNQRSYNDGGIQPFRRQGIAGRLSYMYDSRYVGEVNFGYNGSENFAKGQRFGFFPSVAIGWLVSEEAFMAPYKNIFNKIKLRGSIGQAGNDQIGGRRFAYITTINDGAPGYSWGRIGDYGRGGATEGDQGITNLTWETVTKMNAGFELGLWSALDFQVDIFNDKRENILMQRKIIPSQAGFVTNPYANFGKVDNQGVDLSLLYNKQFTKDLGVSFRGTFTYARSKIVEYDEPAAVVGTYRSRTGTPVNSLWGYYAERLFTANDFDEYDMLKDGIPIPELGSTVRPGDIKYTDLNGDGFITSEDQGVIDGTSVPKIIYGFGASTNYKNWDFSFFFQGTGDSYRIIGGNNYFIPGSGQGTLGNIYSNYADAWTEENPSQEVFWPRLTYGASTNNTVGSTWWKKDMSFLRLKTIELGYSLPQHIAKRAGLQAVRFYVSGNNLFYFSSFKLWDPELDTATGLKYPAMRSIMFGLNFHF